MKKLIFLAVILTFFLPGVNSAQPADSADVYVVTCAPGNASYSIYGHTALRITFRGTPFDMVYNWGIFDFSTPNFVYRFAKGKLDYMLGAYSYERFLEEYISEGTVIFPERVKKKSFRQLIDPYQKVLPWLDFGADMLLGLQADRKASVEDEMFLPIFLRDNFAGAMIIHNGMQQPVAGPVETVVDLPAPPAAGRPWIPQAVLWLVLLFVLLATFVFKNPAIGKVLDSLLFLIYSLIALILVFTNIFSEHDALHFNLLFLGINILIPVLSVMLVAGKKAVKMCRLTLFISVLWLPVSLIAGQGINPALIPLVLIIMVRIFSHCRFGKSL